MFGRLLRVCFFSLIAATSIFGKVVLAEEIVVSFYAKVGAGGSENIYEVVNKSKSKSIVAFKLADHISRFGIGFRQKTRMGGMQGRHFGFGGSSGGQFNSPDLAGESPIEFHPDLVGENLHFEPNASWNFSVGNEGLRRFWMQWQHVDSKTGIRPGESAKFGVRLPRINSNAIDTKYTVLLSDGVHITEVSGRVKRKPREKISADDLDFRKVFFANTRTILGLFEKDEKLFLSEYSLLTNSLAECNNIRNVRTFLELAFEVTTRRVTVKPNFPVGKSPAKVIDNLIDRNPSCFVEAIALMRSAQTKLLSFYLVHRPVAQRDELYSKLETVLTEVKYQKLSSNYKRLLRYARDKEKEERRIYVILNELEIKSIRSIMHEKGRLMISAFRGLKTPKDLDKKLNNLWESKREVAYVDEYKQPWKKLLSGDLDFIPGVEPSNYIILNNGKVHQVKKQGLAMFRWGCGNDELPLIDIGTWPFEKPPFNEWSGTALEIAAEHGLPEVNNESLDFLKEIPEIESRRNRAGGFYTTSLHWQSIPDLVAVYVEYREEYAENQLVVFNKKTKQYVILNEYSPLGGRC